MSKDGFNAEDISSTFARFDNKRRNIVCDDSKLERKKPESMTLPSATNDCGKVVLSGVAAFMKECGQTSTNSHLDEIYEPLEQNGWNNGSQGYGYYRKGIKS